MPDEAAQPGGRLLLTSARAIFVGSGRGATVPWHAVTRPAQAERDLVLIRTDGSTRYRFRCNSYGDALCALVTARQLITGTRETREVIRDKEVGRQSGRKL